VAGFAALAASERQLDERYVTVALRDQAVQIELDDVVARHADRVDGMRRSA
jgi:hypothetical protein